MRKFPTGRHRHEVGSMACAACVVCRRGVRVRGHHSVLTMHKLQLCGSQEKLGEET